MSFKVNTSLFMGLGLIISCLPPGHPPQSFKELDVFADSMAEVQTSGESYIDSNHSEINRISSPDSSYDSVSRPLDLTQYPVDSVGLETIIKDSLKEVQMDVHEEIVPDSYDTLQPVILFETISSDTGAILDLTEEVYNETKDTTISSSMPYEPDENTLVLLHFDEPNPLESLGMIPLIVEDYGTTKTQSLDNFGQAKHFDGISYLELKKDVGLNITTQLTIEALVKPLLPEDSFSDDFGNIVASVGQAGVIYMGNHYVAGALGLNTENEGYQYVYVQAEYYDLPTNKFTHLALTYNGNKILLYVDHELKDEVAVSGIIDEKPDKNMFIGKNGFNGFIGDIDEVRISDIAREF